MKAERMVLVGGGQQRRRPEIDGSWRPIEPLELMAEAARRAAEEAGQPELLREADVIGAVDPIAWSYEDLGSALRARLGASSAKTVQVLPGGNSPCLLLNDVANRIRAGEAQIAVLAGAEALYSRRRARREGVELQDWTPRPPGPRDVLGAQPPLASPLEQRHGLFVPAQLYPLFENALRAGSGRSINEHQEVVSELMSRFAAVAAGNPYAWFPEPCTAEELRTVTEQNRWICFPYPKRFNAIMEVDQSAALVVMSASEADRRGIPPERRVSYLGGASATDAWWATERPDFTTSPAYRRASRAALEEAGVELSEVDRLDLYSCFPCAVELALKELGLPLDDPRPPTVTGGLAYAGGPGNNYSMHALVIMAEAIRRKEARVGYVSALGMTMTKHAMSILGGDPVSPRSSGGARAVEIPEAERTGPLLADAPEGWGRVETYTVLFERGNRPDRVVLVIRLDDGRRTMAHGDATPEVFARFLEREGVGAKGRVVPGGGEAPNRFLLRE